MQVSEMEKKLQRNLKKTRNWFFERLIKLINPSQKNKSRNHELQRGQEWKLSPKRFVGKINKIDNLSKTGTE